ncbi:MAG: hypothetical protein QOJ85_2844, partial [Solirubrobacteraceae bacterium]|nr:hypothetical protein [Solirubrobacteraceae bacterium]
MLAALTVVAAGRNANDTLVLVVAGWWIVAGMIG